MCAPEFGPKKGGDICYSENGLPDVLHGPLLNNIR